MRIPRQHIVFSTIFLISLTLCLSSCTIHSGIIGGGTGAITNGEFKSIDYAQGTASTTNILGIGGNSKEGLALEAKRNLYRNYDFSPYQVIGQTTVDYKTTIYPFVSVTKATISAEIIDFSSSSIDTSLIRENREKWAKPYFEYKYNTNIAPPTPSIFVMNQKVRYKGPGKNIIATVVGINPNSYNIEYRDKDDNLRRREVRAEYLSALQIKTEEELKNPETAPSDDNQQVIEQEIRLLTPENQTGRLIQFIYRGEVYRGEVIKKEPTRYLMKMMKSDGTPVTVLIPIEDIIGY